MSRLQKEKLDVREYLAPYIRNIAKASGWKGYDFSFDHAVDIGKEMWSENLELKDEDYYSDKTDPIPWKDKKESQGVVNLVSRASSYFRDRYMIKQIAEILQTHKRLFIVFGGSHAVVQEPAIRKLMEKNESSNI